MTTWLISALLVLPTTPTGPQVLDALPDDFQVVGRVVEIEATADDLKAMLDAMSPTLAAQASPSIDAAVRQFVASYGRDAAESTFLIVMPLPGPEAMQGGQTPPLAIVVEDAPYEGVLQSIADADAEPEGQDGGYDAIEGPDGSTVFAFDGGAFAAFGEHEELIALIAGGAGDGSSLSAKIGEAGVTRLFAGDVGLYVDLEAVQEVYGEAISQAKGQFFGAMEAAGQQAGNPEMMDGAIAFYGRFFDAMADARSVVVGLDAEEQGLSLGIDLGVSPGTEAAEALAAFGTGPVEGPEETLPRLPDDSGYYFVFNANAGALASLQEMGMSMWFGRDADAPPEFERAIEAMGAAGPVRMAGTSSFDDGLRQAYLVELDDPEAYVSSALDLYRAMDAAEGQVGRVMKAVEITPGAETYDDVSMTRVVMTFDLEAMSGGPQAPAESVAAIRSIFGGDSITTWVGAKDRYSVFVNAPDWPTARGLIDRIREAEGAVGESDSYRAVRPKLPEQVSALVMVNVRGLVDQFSSMFSAMFDREIEPPADLPDGPALVGVTVVSSEDGLHLDAFVPSPVGRVIEHGLLPLFRQLDGAGR